MEPLSGGVPPPSGNTTPLSDGQRQTSLDYIGIAYHLRDFEDVKVSRGF